MVDSDGNSGGNSRDKKRDYFIPAYNSVREKYE
jgi:hypothetical protein